MNIGFAQDKSLKLIALGLIITALGGLHFYDKYQSISKAEKAVEARLELSYKDRLIEAQQKAIKFQDELLEQSKKNVDEKDKKIDALGNSLSVAISELRNRDKRPTNYSPPISAPATCTGTQLYQEDAEFLTREAARADKIIIERDYYYKEYEDARKKLDEYSKQGTNGR